MLNDMCHLDQNHHIPKIFKFWLYKGATIRLPGVFFEKNILALVLAKINILALTMCEKNILAPSIEKEMSALYPWKENVCPLYTWK